MSYIKDDLFINVINNAFIYRDVVCSENVIDDYKKGMRVKIKAKIESFF